MAGSDMKRKPFLINRFSRKSVRIRALAYFLFIQKEIFDPEWISLTASERRFERSFLATADGSCANDVRSLFSRPPCVPCPRVLPLKTWTGLFLGSSRTACMPGAPSAAPRHARGVTSREVSRCNVAPPRCDVTARVRAAGRAA